MQLSRFSENNEKKFNESSILFLKNRKLDSLRAIRTLLKTISFYK